MKRVFLCSLALLLISVTANADSYSIIDALSFNSTGISIGDGVVLGYGGDTVNELERASDYIIWEHKYTFEVKPPSITSATLTLGLRDDGGCFDFWEFGVGWTEGGTWGIGEVNTADYSYQLGFAGLDDGSYQVRLASLLGDFFIDSSKLVINYEGEATGAVPVPEPTNLLLLGTGLFGLAGLSRKKIFYKK